MTLKLLHIPYGASLIAMLALAGCQGNTAQAPSATATPAASPCTQVAGTTAGATVLPTEQALAKETNPPGDIPDTQQFVAFTSTSGGYGFKSPEGWSHTDSGTDVSFIDKFDGVKITIAKAAAAPTAASAQNDQVATLQKSCRAVQIIDVTDVTLPGGAAVRINYTSNSDPNAITGKQVRLNDQAFLFYKNGKLATMTLWAPLGTDNVDQWKLMAESFKWM